MKGPRPFRESAPSTSLSAGWLCERKARLKKKGAEKKGADLFSSNIVRACDAALDMSQHLIHRERLGVPQSTRNVFTLLAQGGWI